MLGAVLERVAECLPVHGVRRWDGEGVQRSGLALFNHCRGRDHLLHRPGFVRGSDRPDSAVLRGNLAGVVRVRCVRVRHGDDVAGLGVGDDDHPPFGTELVLLALDRLLGKVLQVRVERELDVLAVHRGGQLVNAHGDAQTVRADLEKALAGSPFEDVVLGLFETRLPGCAVLEEPDNPAGHRSVGIDPLAGAFGDDAGNLKLGYPVFDVGLQILRHDVVALGSGQGRLQVVAVHTEHRGQFGDPLVPGDFDEFVLAVDGIEPAESLGLRVDGLVHHDVVPDDAAGQDRAG